MMTGLHASHGRSRKKRSSNNRNYAIFFLLVVCIAVSLVGVDGLPVAYQELIHELVRRSRHGPSIGIAGTTGGSEDSNRNLKPVGIMFIGVRDSQFLIKSMQAFDLNVFLTIFEPSNSVYDAVMQGIQALAMMNNVIAINKYPGHFISDSIDISDPIIAYCYAHVQTFADCQSVSTFTSSHLFSAVGSTCSQVLFVKPSPSLHGDVHGGYLSSLLGASRLIRHCRPYIVIENITSEATVPLFQALSATYSYVDIYWQLVPELDVDKSIPRIIVNIIATDSAIATNYLDADRLREMHMFRYSPGMDYLFQYDLDALLVPDLSQFIRDEDLLRTWRPSCRDLTLAPCFQYSLTVYHRVETVDAEATRYQLGSPEFDKEYLHAIGDLNVFVSLEDLLYPFHNATSALEWRLYDRLRLVAQQQTKTNRSVSLQFLNESMPYIMSTSSIDNLAMVHCHRWMSRLMQAVHLDLDANRIDKSDEAMRRLVSDFTVEQIEFADMTAACEAFYRKQYFLKREVNTAQALITAHTDPMAEKAYYVNKERMEMRKQGRVATQIPHAAHLQPHGVDPFAYRYDAQHCYEPLFCDHTLEFQRRIRAWQFPDDSESTFGDNPIEYGDHRYSNGHENKSSIGNDHIKRTCANSKFLIFEPMSSNHGIGSIISQIAHMFRFSMCLNRILVLAPNEATSMVKWRFPGCRGNTFECYFEQIHGCRITEEDMLNAPVTPDGNFLDAYPLKNKRLVRITGLPVHGKCRLCHSVWDGNIDVFDGLVVNQHNYIPFSSFDSGTHDMLHFTSFTTAIKLTWMPQFVRYLMKPRPWFADLMKYVVRSSLVGPDNLIVDSIPKPFASLHVRYGMKNAEEPPQQLARYMEALKYKHPWIKEVFVSTETDSVINALREHYTEFNFYHLKYPRIEFLYLGDVPTNTQDFIAEYVYSMANLYISIEADAFVGTLTSNWCMMIHYLERTRGDGGFEYFTMDRGSSLSVCF